MIQFALSARLGRRSNARTGALLVALFLTSALVSADEDGRHDRQDDDARSRHLTLRKCVDPAGGIAFQSATCAPRSREAWSREEERTPASTQPGPRGSTDGSASSRRVTVLRASPRKGHAARQSSRSGQCEAARRKAARKRDLEWNRLGFDDLSRLDAWVAERCD